jgi:predicted N-acyltransferase
MNSNFVTRVVDDPAAIDAAAWNSLLEAQPSATPFMRHEYLAALHA